MESTAYPPKINNGMTSEPRIKSANAAGIQEGAYGLLPNRLYRTSGGESEAVDYMTAWSRAQQRKAGELPPLKGGIDDDSPEMYMHPHSTPFGKTFAAQHKALDDKDVDMLREPGEMGKPAESQPPPHVDAPPQPEAREPKADTIARNPAPVVSSTMEMSKPPIEVRSMPEMLPGGFSDTPGFAVQTRALPPVESIRPVRQEPAIQHGASQYDQVGSQVQLRYVQVPQYIEKVVEKPVEKIVEKVVEKPVEKIVEKQVDGPFEKWSKQRVRVQIATKDMAFSVSAIACIRGAFGITVFLPTSGDSFGFVPKTGSSVRLSTKDLTVDTVFTGATFEIEELAIMGIVFVEDPSKSTRMQADIRSGAEAERS